MSKFKRIIFFAKFTANEIEDLDLTIYDNNCYTRIARAGDGHVDEIIRRIFRPDADCISG